MVCSISSTITNGMVDWPLGLACSILKMCTQHCSSCCICLSLHMKVGLEQEKPSLRGVQVCAGVVWSPHSSWSSSVLTIRTTCKTAGPSVQLGPLASRPPSHHLTSRHLETFTATLLTLVLYIRHLQVIHFYHQFKIIPSIRFSWPCCVLV